MSTNYRKIPGSPLSAGQLRFFFVTHLNRVYCAKSHLQERLPEIRLHASFADLKLAITETLDDVEKQIVRMDTIFGLLDSKPDFEHCEGMIGLIEDAFTAIHQDPNDRQMRDLSILFYLQNIESIEIASFQMLKLAAPVMDKKEIRQLLRENRDEAGGDLSLLRTISTNYFSR